MSTTHARKARIVTAPTTSPTTAVQLVAQAKAHATGGTLGQLDRAVAALTQRSRQVGIVGLPDADIARLSEQLADTLEAGEPVPADHRETIAAAIAEHESRAAEAKVIEHARYLLTARREDAERNAADPGLKWLDEQLQTMMTDVRGITPDLQGITTADEALDAGPAGMTAWKQLRGHVDQYAELRTAQRTLLATARGGSQFIPRDVHWAGTTRVPFDETYCEAAGLIKAWDRTGYNEGRFYEPEPWPGAVPADRDLYALVPSTDPAAFLLWLANRGDAWVPTSSELVDALEARRVAINLKVPMPELRSVQDVRVENLRHLRRLQPAGAAR